jgi:small subunit ribosomal protein S2
MNKEFDKLQKHLGGIKDMPRVPDVIVVVDQRRELTAIKEAMNLNIPVISILDTNCDPDLVDIPIPGNDDSIGSIKLILKTLGKSILNGSVNSAD